MSRLLLDTHALLWAVAAPDRLSAPVRQHLLDPSTDLLVSAASAWEIATKHRLGKLPDAAVLLDGWDDALVQLRADPLPITHGDALRAGRYGTTHRDPFDRLLAAQAEHRGARLVTADAAFAAFPVTVLW